MSRTASVQSRTSATSFVSWCAKHKLFCFGVLAALWIYLLYSRALDAPFLYDDLDQIVNNPALHSWVAVYARFFCAPVAFTSGFLGGGGSTYRPLFWLSIALDWRLWGVQGPGGFHFTNLLLHWLNGVLLFQLLRKLGVRAIVAATAALVWLGLPITSEAVAWVSARAYLLSTLFLLAALLSASAYAERKTWRSLAIFGLAALGAVLSHEQGLLLLPLLPVVLFAKGRSTQPSWPMLGGVALLADAVSLGGKYAVGAKAGHGSPTLWAVGEEFWKYIQLIFLPLHMSLERSTSVPVNHPTILGLIAWAGLIAVLSSIVALRRRLPAVSLALSASCIALLPYCGVVYIYQGMAERFAYFAAMGFVVALLILAFRTPKRIQPVLLGLGLLWVGWGAWRLRDRVANWNDPVDLYRSSLQATPNSPYLYDNLGFSLREAGDQGGALAAYRNAVRLKADYPQALTSIGDIYAIQGKPADAVNEYRQSLSLDPNDGKTILNYGAALQQLGDKAGAEGQFKRLIALAPRDSAAYVDLGGLYSEEGRTDEAIQSFERAISVDSTDPDAYFDMAVMFQQRGQDNAALALYKKVLQLKPDDPQTLLYMSKLHP